MGKIDLRYQTQAFRHKPDEGIYGDCARTALACLLEIPRDDVPHFFGNDRPAYETMDVWLKSRGLARVNVLFGGEDGLETVIKTVSNINPGLRFSLVGKSRTGVNHVVLCQDGQIDHDPSINQSGITGPSSDGYYWIEFLTPCCMYDKKEGG